VCREATHTNTLIVAASSCIIVRGLAATARAALCRGLALFGGGRRLIMQMSPRRSGQLAEIDGEMRHPKTPANETDVGFVVYNDISAGGVPVHSRRAPCGTDGQRWTYARTHAPVIEELSSLSVAASRSVARRSSNVPPRGSLPSRTTRVVEWTGGVLGGLVRWPGVTAAVIHCVRVRAGWLHHRRRYILSLAVITRRRQRRGALSVSRCTAPRHAVAYRSFLRSD